MIFDLNLEPSLPWWLPILIVVIAVMALACRA